MQAQNTHIPLAHSGPISNETLERLITHAEDAQNGRVTDEGGTLIIMCAAGLFRECLNRRLAAEVIHDLVNPDNVVQLMRPEPV
ncbi:MAG TPA: hypothetical protein ENK28_03490 [Aliiroseovarius sp.]|nr:hypothetical protein [Aliiroseovarius sp.]